MAETSAGPSLPTGAQAGVSRESTDPARGPGGVVPDAESAAAKSAPVVEPVPAESAVPPIPPGARVNNSREPADRAGIRGEGVRVEEAVTGESAAPPSAGDYPVRVQPDTARVQGDRSAATRKRVMDATLECLLEFGYAGTTTSAIQARAGVSRGAMTHQFPSKAGLMIAAVQYLSDVRSRRILKALGEMPPGGNRLREGLRLAWAEYDGDLFKAALELWTASRTDDALQRALLDAERELGQRQRALFGDLMRPSNDELLTKAEVDLIARLMRGTALTNILRRSWTNPDEMVEESLRAVGRA
jgi:AcrR family transcriptional regulator